MNSLVLCCACIFSFFPLVLADQALNEVGHRLISASRLLLIVARLLRFALLASEEAVFVAGFLVLRSCPVSSL